MGHDDLGLLRPRFHGLSEQEQHAAAPRLTSARSGDRDRLPADRKALASKWGRTRIGNGPLISVTPEYPFGLAHLKSAQHPNLGHACVCGPQLQVPHGDYGPPALGIQHTDP